MPSSATILVDDQDPNVHYLCPVLKEHVSGSYYNNTWTQPEETSCGAGWFSYTFNGTGVHIAASFVNISDFPVRIDNNDFLLYTGNGTFDSQKLSDGQHTITYGMGNLSVFPAFDYLTVTAGPSTMLYGKTIAVDDNDKSITFHGHWSPSSPYPPSPLFNYPSRLYDGTSHWTSNVGDTMEFKFEGSSVAVYGMVAYNTTALRNITADFIVDGVSQTATISNKTLPYVPMVELFRADLQDGNHTLLLNLTDIQGERALGIDFIAYNASYNQLTPASHGHDLNVPAWAAKLGIALASIAGFAFLLTVGIIFWQRFRRDRHQGHKYTPSA
jgi:hypothetical protein